MFHLQRLYLSKLFPDKVQERAAMEHFSAVHLAFLNFLFLG